MQRGGDNLEIWFLIASIFWLKKIINSCSCDLALLLLWFWIPSHTVPSLAFFQLWQPTPGKPDCQVSHTDGETGEQVRGCVREAQVPLGFGYWVGWNSAQVNQQLLSQHPPLLSHTLVFCNPPSFCPFFSCFYKVSGHDLVLPWCFYHCSCNFKMLQIFVVTYDSIFA